MIFRFIKKLVKYYVDKFINWLRMQKFNLELDNEIKKYHKELDKKVIRWNYLYKQIYDCLFNQDGIVIPKRVEEEFFVGSSIQFRLEDLNENLIIKFIKNCNKRGVEIKWFGDKNPSSYTSRYDSWEYIKDIPVLHNTLDILKTMKYI